MNKVILMGRLTSDPEIRYTSGENQRAVARYTLAVERRRRKGAEQEADFINCVIFDRGAEFAEKYLFQGTKIVVSGRLQTGSYINRGGQKVYTTDVVVEEQEFAESKTSGHGASQVCEESEETPEPEKKPKAKSKAKAKPKTAPKAPAAEDGFMSIDPDMVDGLPFD